MNCQPIVPFTFYDVAAGLDIVNQGMSKGIKTSDGTVWAPVKMTPMEAAAAGVRLGYLCNGRICER